LFAAEAELNARRNAGAVSTLSASIKVNLSKQEQRTLHALARGGAIAVDKDDRGKIMAVNCATREGWTLADCTLSTFAQLKRRRLIASADGGPYRITRAGREAVRSQPDNRS
jgi:uncharacterized protein YjhX (UPF0386 family)